MAIAGFLANSNVASSELPKYYTAVSRCYRAEISQLASEKGIYRYDTRKVYKLIFFSIRDS